MTEKSIINEIPISMHELKKELEKIKKRDKELNFRAAKTEEYLQQITSFKKSDELNEKLVKLNIPRLKDQHIKKIVDILPTTVKDLKVVLQGYTLTINNENAKKIVDTVNQFVKNS
jgi:DNA-directed RNA polymerase subunit F